MPSRLNRGGVQEPHPNKLSQTERKVKADDEDGDGDSIEKRATQLALSDSDNDTSKIDVVERIGKIKNHVSTISKMKR